MRRRLPHGLGLLIMMAAPSIACAQPAAVHKTTLQDQPFPPAPLHTVTVRTLMDPGGEIQPHTHPGLEMAYVVEGRAEVTIRGRAGRILAAGDSFAMPQGAIHAVKNIGPGALTIVSTYVVDQTQPIASPAP
jgi:quercetin dioxygenase-like cupin family protein